MRYLKKDAFCGVEGLSGGHRDELALVHSGPPEDVPLPGTYAGSFVLLVRQDKKTSKGGGIDS